MVIKINEDAVFRRAENLSENVLTFFDCRFDRRVFRAYPFNLLAGQRTSLRSRCFGSDALLLSGCGGVDFNNARTAPERK